MKTIQIQKRRRKTIYGPGFIKDRLCGCTFRISPKSFYQVNPVQTEILYNTAMDYAELTGKETVIDAYCGTGTIGLIAARNAKRVIGVELIGGYGEKELKSYEAVANVTANTNGLKKATKAEDGSFVIGARQNGTESGIKDAELKVADGITATVKPGNGSYGEFLRVDLTGNYGDLGAHMQSVEWAYYGNDSTYTNRLANYGTKFAADNWMHKMMGIQLGLTHSVRCQLPAGTDGTGHWKLTVYALGYQDQELNMMTRYTLYAGHRDLHIEAFFDEPLDKEIFCTGVQDIVGTSKSFSDHKGLVGSWGTDWPVNDTVKYAKETVGLGTCIPQRYVKSEEKDKANFLYTITAPGNKYFQYHTTFTSMKETFGYKTPEAWFAHLREWKEELAHPVTVRIKDNRTNK